MNIKLTDTGKNYITIKDKADHGPHKEKYCIRAIQAHCSIVVYVSAENLRKIAKAILAEIKEVDIDETDGVLEVNGARI